MCKILFCFFLWRCVETNNCLLACGSLGGWSLFFYSVLFIWSNDYSCKTRIVSNIYVYMFVFKQILVINMYVDFETGICFKYKQAGGRAVSAEKLTNEFFYFVYTFLVFRLEIFLSFLELERKRKSTFIKWWLGELTWTKRFSVYKANVPIDNEIMVNMSYAKEKCGNERFWWSCLRIAMLACFPSSMNKFIMWKVRFAKKQKEK